MIVPTEVCASEYWIPRQMDLRAWQTTGTKFKTDDTRAVLEAAYHTAQSIVIRQTEGITSYVCLQLKYGGQW